MGYSQEQIEKMREYILAYCNHCQCHRGNYDCPLISRDCSLRDSKSVIENYKIVREFEKEK